MAQVLWKNMIVMNIQICMISGDFVVVLVKGCKNPTYWRQGTKKRKIVPPFQIILFGLPMALPQIKSFTTCNFWRIWFYMLQRVTNHCLLLKIHGYGIWFCNNVGIYTFHHVVKSWLKCSQLWWKKLRNITAKPIPFPLRTST